MAVNLFGTTGRDRRAWLDRQGQNALDAIQYYAGPGVPVNALAQLADMFNPVADIGRAGTSARGVVRPGATISERVNALGNMSVDMASVLAPMAGAAYADDAARGLTEGFANLTMPADDMAARFILDEDGAIRAWHGSPHDFDRFSMDKIGTGEGAQAYGHGLYFAENEAVARGYRDALTDAPAIFKLTGGDRTAAMEKTRLNLSNIEDRIAEVMQKPDTPNRRARLAMWEAQKAQNAAALRQLEENETFGRLYEVNIDANPEDFLDWDAPLSAQPQRVRNALAPNPERVEELRPKGTDATIMRRALAQNEGAWSDIDLVIDNDRALYEMAVERARRDGLTPDMLDAQGDSVGSWFAKKYRGYIDLMRPTEDVSRMVKGREQELRAAGIPGVRYLDAGSRGAGDGSRNYVVFDDSLISILNKYGVALGGVGLGAMTMQGEEQY